MESTSIYWHPVWRVLEGIGGLKLVNPYFIRQLPGRKSDMRDAAWIGNKEPYKNLPHSSLYLNNPSAFFHSISSL